MTHDDHAHPPAEGDPTPTAHALKGTLSLPRPLSEPELRAGVDAFLGELTRTLRDQGCGLIGHIKGILESGKEGHLFFSVTSFEQQTRFKGGLDREADELNLTLNVIVYGVGTEEVEALVLAGLREHLGNVGVRP